MTCTPFDVPGLGRGFICTRTRSKPKCACGRPADLLCDWKVPSRKSGTCDKPICSRCTTAPAPEKDLCPEHAEAFKRWKAERE